MAAIEAQARVAQLTHELETARHWGLAGNAAYMRDLLAELRGWQAVRTAAAVTEIAALRAELDGPTRG